MTNLLKPSLGVLTKLGVRRHFAVSSALAAVLTITSSAFATSINLNFGEGSVPSSTFGAASGQAGDWDHITTNGLTSGLIDVSGGATAVGVTVTSESMNGSRAGGSGDFATLMDKNFYSTGSSWSVDFTGLSDGTYTLYLYDPENPAIETGSGTANGVAFADINADPPLTSFVLGSNYEVIKGVTVSGGILNILGSDGAFSSGLAGLQIVPTATSPVPEPTTLLLLGTGLVGAGVRRARRRH
jgi:hypothetical protein